MINDKTRDGLIRHWAQSVVNGHKDTGELDFCFGAQSYSLGMEKDACGDAKGAMLAFKMAEKSYLAARRAGSADASLCLGYVYAYDRCGGDYEIDAGDLYGLTLDERACKCFKEAADAGSVEGWYKLGDMIAKGVGAQYGLTPKACYEHAWEMTDPSFIDNYAVAGSIALRLAKIAEQEGSDDAYGFYEIAIMHFEVAIEEGNWYYAKRMAEAQAGRLREIQRIDANEGPGH